MGMVGYPLALYILWTWGGVRVVVVNYQLTHYILYVGRC